MPLYVYEKAEWMCRQTGQGKFVPDHSMKVKGANRSVAPLILDLGTIRGSGLTSRPGRFNARKEPRYILSGRFDEP
jgi:hypothetical protein